LAIKCSNAHPLTQVQAKYLAEDWCCPWLSSKISGSARSRLSIVLRYLALNYTIYSRSDAI